MNDILQQAELRDMYSASIASRDYAYLTVAPVVYKFIQAAQFNVFQLKRALSAASNPQVAYLDFTNACDNALRQLQNCVYVINIDRNLAATGQSGASAGDRLKHYAATTRSAAAAVDWSKRLIEQMLHRADMMRSAIAYCTDASVKSKAPTGYGYSFNKFARACSPTKDELDKPAVAQLLHRCVDVLSNDLHVQQRALDALPSADQAAIDVQQSTISAVRNLLASTDDTGDALVRLLSLLKQDAVREPSLQGDTVRAAITDAIKPVLCRLDINTLKLASRAEYIQHELADRIQQALDELRAQAIAASTRVLAGTLTAANEDAFLQALNEFVDNAVTHELSISYKTGVCNPSMLYAVIYEGIDEYCDVSRSMFTPPVVDLITDLITAVIDMLRH